MTNEKNSPCIDRCRSDCPDRRRICWISGVGANLAKGAIQEVKSSGLLGAFTGGVKSSAGGIAAAVFFGYLASLIAKPKIKKQ